MKTSELDYDLPEELIAQEPIEPRDRSRLMVLHRDSGQIEHRIFHDIGEYLAPGDLLVLNESRVLPARLHGRKEPTGGQVELLLLRQLDTYQWRCLVGGARTREGSVIRLYEGDDPTDITAKVLDTGERGERTLEFSESLDETHLKALGQMPLPPYIHRPLEDPERYQTVYARTLGSAAAPTAGLHFTPELLLDLRQQGVRLTMVTLHVGLDTFRPIAESRVEEHAIHTEWAVLDVATAEQINQAKLRGNRVIAVGTTSVRVLETAARRGLFQTPQGSYPPGEPSRRQSDSQSAGDRCPWRSVSPFEGFTDLYITPGFEFQVVDTMITNYHLPKSTLLALVMAFAGKENIRRAYEVAVEERYRFYSLGDAMLIL